VVNLLLALLSFVQEPELIRGSVDRSQGGELVVKTPEGRVVSCQTNTDTHHESPTVLWTPGDRIEGWMWPAADGCRWLSLKLLLRANRPERPKLRLDLNPVDSIVQRGNLVFSGIVLRIDGRQMVVRARSGTLYTLLLRSDTHLFGDGSARRPDEIPFNRSVYVRAGSNFEGQIEVFRMAWGEILHPQ